MPEEEQQNGEAQPSLDQPSPEELKPIAPERPLGLPREPSEMGGTVPSTTDQSAEASSEEDTSITDDQLTRAVQAGLSIDEARAFNTKDGLDRVLDLVARSAYQMPQYGPPADQQAQEAPEPKGPDKFVLEPSEDLDDEVMKRLESMNEHYHKHITDLNKQNQDIQSQYTNARSGDLLDWFDDKLDSLGEEYHSVIGKGSTDALNPASSQFQVRQQMWNTLSGIYQANPNLPGDELFEATRRAVLHQFDSKRETQRKSTRVKKTVGQVTGQPTGKTPASSFSGSPDRGAGALSESDRSELFDMARQFNEEAGIR
jgi:hypothetical protein